MKRSVNYKLSRLFCCNTDLNRRIICIKRSWDEVEDILNRCNPNCCKPNRCKPDCCKPDRCDK